MTDILLLQASKVQVIFVSFETLRKPRGVDVFVEAWKQSLQAWQKAVVGCLKGDQSQSKSRKRRKRYRYVMILKR